LSAMLASSSHLYTLHVILALLCPSQVEASVQRVKLESAPLSHLLLDEQTGQLYVGGVNNLYQLNSNLDVLAHVKTGPNLDSPDCLPPISQQDCPSATVTPNHNKLLLLEDGVGEEPGNLIVCGSLFQGICNKRSLSNISHIIYQTSNPVDTQYVAANDPRVSTVGVIITAKGKQEEEGASGTLHLLLVGRGYTSRGPGDIPPITTRRLFPANSLRRAFSQEEELGKLVVGSYSEYNNHFVKAFIYGNHAYFLFSRRDMWHRKEYRTYVSRLCISDRSFYSYVEVPLLCRGGYNLAQGAWLGKYSGKATLFVVMATGQASTPVATSHSALCVYGMDALDALMRQAQEVCYTEAGQGRSGGEEAYIEYAVSSKCLRLPKDSLSEYPCGGEHTPSPIASAVALPATPTVTMLTLLTAVAVATEAGHTIAFLGDVKGQLHKVFVRPDWSGDLYGSLAVDSGAVGADLLLDVSQQYLYVLTNDQVPVSSCERQTDCSSCLSVRDPYCGWCVLEGRCVHKHECQRHLQANHWLWSFESTNQCVTVQNLQPANQSRAEQTQVRAADKVRSYDLLCFRCVACVSCVWGCNWCPIEQLCTHNHSCPTPNIILSQRVRQLSACLCLPFCVPVSVRLSVCLCQRLWPAWSYLEHNLRPLSGRTSSDPDSIFKYLQRHKHLCLSSQCLVHLYDCSAGQSDCSQCWAVPREYGCVWCPGRPAPICVYNQSCFSEPVVPVTGPLEGGVLLTITGSNLGMRYQDVVGRVHVAGVPCVPQMEGYQISTRVVCELQPSGKQRVGPVSFSMGTSLPGGSTQIFTYQDPQLLDLVPDKGPVSGGTRVTIRGRHLLTGQMSDLSVFLGPWPCRIGGRIIVVTGRNLDVVQQPIMSVWVEPQEVQRVKRKRRVAFLTAKQQLVFNSTMRCSVLSSSQMTCPTPAVFPDLKVKGVWFQLDNVQVHFESIKGKSFTYYPNPKLFPLNSEAADVPYHFKPGGVIAVEGRDLTRAMGRREVIARLGDQKCEVKTLDSTHLYCEPPEVQPMSVDDGHQLPRLKVFMGNLKVDLGLVQYDSDSMLSPVPLAAQIGLGAGAAAIILMVLVVILMYRRKSKQALRDYKKVLLQLETMEINVGDQCRKEFTDLMTEMMDLSSDVGGPGLPLLDYRVYAERVFFPGQQMALLSRQLDLPESRRLTVEQGLQQLINLLNNRLFLTRFIHTLEAQQGFSQRDRGYVASLLTIALHDKLEYFTEVMKSLLQDLVQQYVTKNPKLMLRRTETVVEKMLTNWMSICLYSFLKEVAGEPLYMLYRAIKYQVDKGPVDAVTGKAKRTLNDSHLLREDIDYCAMTLTVLVKNGVEVQPCPVKVLDVDTITQVKDKILDQVYRGAPFSQRPAADSLDLEWRSGQAGHLTLSDDDVTAIVQGHWKRLNTLQHYKVPDGATVALIPRSQSSGGISQVFQTGEKTPMLEGEEEEGFRLWHLVKSSEDPEIPKHRKSSMRERERAKAIPEIYLTRLLSMKGTLQKFVDDVFVAILNTKRPPPIAVRFFFDFLDDMAEKHGIDDPDTVHIWKTNSLPLRFWVNILKNPQFVLDVQITDSIDAILSVIAQTFIDSCTTSEHKVGRDSPVNKLLYAREIPRYKQLVERYYSDIRSAASGCYQEMNSYLTELSGVSKHKPIWCEKLNGHLSHQVIMSLEEDASGQKMQLAYRLQQVAALVENKVTDL
uniref:Plexin B3 n=1 Tax=Oryzias latipes TaxID=8090 RepID=A0A3P9I978_ORYLA